MTIPWANDETRSEEQIRAMLQAAIEETVMLRWEVEFTLAEVREALGKPPLHEEPGM